MSHAARIKIAALATALFLGGVSAGGVALRTSAGPNAPSPPTAGPAVTEGGPAKVAFGGARQSGPLRYADDDLGAEVEYGGEE
jgi:hypothetical protein